MKVRTLCPSQALMAKEAEKFRRHFRDRFEGKFVFSGLYRRNSTGRSYPLYYVVWIPPKDYPYCGDLEMTVKKQEILETIPMKVALSGNKAARDNLRPSPKNGPKRQKASY
jgi:hypothetical protein